MKPRFRDTYEIWKHLDDEVRYFAKRLGEENPPGILHRSYVRSVFSFIEGVLFSLKQECLTFPEELTLEQKLIILERSAKPKENGTASMDSQNIPLMLNIKFTFNLFHKVFETRRKVNFNGQGFDAFAKAIKIRNRITHPKTANDLKISEENFQIVHHAHLWFESNSMAMLWMSMNKQTKCVKDKAGDSPSVEEKLVIAMKEAGKPVEDFLIKLMDCTDTKYSEAMIETYRLAATEEDEYFTKENGVIDNLLRELGVNLSPSEITEEGVIDNLFRRLGVNLSASETPSAPSHSLPDALKN